MEQKFNKNYSRFVSMTERSNREWMFDGKGYLKTERYIHRSLRGINFDGVRRNRTQDQETLRNLLYNCPDEGRKLIEDFGGYDEEKHLKIVKWIVYQEQISCGIFADERMGKDSVMCKIFEDCIKYCVEKKYNLPRIITLGNMRCPPFVLDGENTDFKYFKEVCGFSREDLNFIYPEGIPSDMYFSFKNIPTGKKEQEVWIYASEMEMVLPARTSGDKENRLFSMIAGTFSQNHTKIFGCCKLASKVDLNFLRGMNVKIIKYISSFVSIIIPLCF